MTALATSTATAPRRRASMSRDRRWALRWSYFFLVVFAVFFLTPPIYMLITSLKTSQEISAAANPWWVYDPTLGNYRELLGSSQYLIFFRNSALVSVIVVTVTMLISVPAAFALSRMRFWGSAALATGIFLTYLIPETLLFIPLFKMFAVFNELTGIQLINRWWVLVLIYPTLTVPFCTWIMIGYFASIPKELDEAALVDGASYRQILLRVFIPVALPGLIAATIFAFTVSWAQFLYPLAFTTSADQLVLPVGIVTTLIKGDVFNWGADHDRRAARRGASAADLCFPDGLLYRRADRRRHQGVTPVGWAKARNAPCPRGKSDVGTALRAFAHPTIRPAPDRAPAAPASSRRSTPRWCGCPHRPRGSSRCRRGRRGSSPSRRTPAPCPWGSDRPAS